MSCPTIRSPATPRRRSSRRARTHWFGTDQLGRDIFSRVVVATRLDFFIAVASVVLVFLMGGLAGVAAGFFGGWTDRIVGRIADTIMAFPLFVLAMGIVAALGNTVQNIVFATAIINFPLYARVARAEANVRRDAGFVEAARLSGNSDWRILAGPDPAQHHADHDGADVADHGLRHPQRRRPVLHRARRAAADAGMGHHGRGRRANIVSGEWWIALLPGAALMVAVFCFNLLGDGLRDIVDPRRRT
jgi:peptide/nickel transport system permease protein